MHQGHACLALNKVKQGESAEGYDVARRLHRMSTGATILEEHGLNSITG